MRKSDTKWLNLTINPDNLNSKLYFSQYCANLLNTIEV